MAPSPLHGIRIVLVDDDADNLEVMTLFLERFGASVIPATSADEAMRQLVDAVPDAVVTDIGMPGEDGFALLRRVRQLPSDRGRDVPAIALTAYARPEDREAVLTAGFQAYVTKPVEPRDLVQTIADVVAAGRQPPGALRDSAADAEQDQGADQPQGQAR
jgi:CheY-like chemotaxis protein